MLGDPERLEQLIYNLVDNAVKFSPEGGPVEVSTEVVGDEVHVRVADRGVGLASAQTGGDVTRFSRGHDPRVTRVTGLGVGLYFCRKVAEQHGGSLELHPRADGGTVASVRLPYYARGAAAERQLDPESAPLR